MITGGSSVDFDTKR
jgi:hypothetical protein